MKKIPKSIIFSVEQNINLPKMYIFWKQILKSLILPTEDNYFPEGGEMHNFLKEKFEEPKLHELEILPKNFQSITSKILFK